MLASSRLCLEGGGGEGTVGAPGPPHGTLLCFCLSRVPTQEFQGDLGQGGIPAHDREGVVWARSLVLSWDSGLETLLVLWKPQTSCVLPVRGDGASVCHVGGRWVQTPLCVGTHADFTHLWF